MVGHVDVPCRVRNGDTLFVHRRYFLPEVGVIRLHVADQIPIGKRITMTRHDGFEGKTFQVF